jgi:hypothetical protein
LFAHGDVKVIDGVSCIASFSSAAAASAGAKSRTIDGHFENLEKHVNLVVHASRDADPAQIAATIDFTLVIDRATVQIAPRTVRLRPGEWTLLHAGTPGVAVFIRAREE